MQDIVRKIRIEAPVEIVWRYLVDAEKLQRWLMRLEGEIAPGRSFQLIYDGPTPDGTTCFVHPCTVTEMTPPTRLAMTWTYSGLQNVDTLVSFDLKADGDATELTLTHAGWDKVPEAVRAAQHADYDGGWAEGLEDLVRQVAADRRKN
ncbi:SRPBCC family protein [Gimibacter soli]|uniref:SRPBCC domain-containing protein n=1 Tax=Gimibacter soli TaxID=3024400 RepID=A0AAE9XQ69_9PROT|nr:SRPBCC domain-containing protein [Gimibacter soli]WCL55167.1 SRPBCC domain-containing protein [Gimibacter soli]